jgi:hypothetical protein
MGWGVPAAQLSPSIVAWDTYRQDMRNVLDPTFDSATGKAYLKAFNDWLAGTSLTFEEVTGEPRRCLVLIPRVMQPNADRVDRDRYRFVGPCNYPRREDSGDWGTAGHRTLVTACAARRGVAAAIIGDAEAMRRVLAIVAGLVVLSSAPAQAATDEDQVRGVLNGMNGLYNRSDFKEFAAHLCADMTKAAGFEAGWYASRKSDGPTQITINSVEVTGGPHPQAVANVRFQAANRADAKTLDVEFLREGAEWKACHYDAGKYI